jgi:hypothetical protein
MKTIKISLILSCLALPALTFAASDAVKTDAASAEAAAPTPKVDGVLQQQRDAQNPLTAKISVPVQNNTYFNVGPSNQTSNALNIQPVVPFELNDDWNLLTRAIIPMTTEPGFVTGGGSNTGMGNTILAAYFSPKKMIDGKYVWGVAPLVYVPASNTDVGTDAWGGGVSAVGIAVHGRWVYGGVINYIAAPATRNSPQVNVFTLQYVVNYSFPSGWFLTSSPVNTYDKRAAPGDRWNLLVGPGIGKVTKINGHKYNFVLQAFKNVIKPSGNSSDFSVQAMVVFMFDK